MALSAQFPPVSENTAPLFKIAPATRTALIIGGLFVFWFAFAFLWVFKDGQRILREKLETRAVNRLSGAGEMVLIPGGKMTMGAIDGAPDEQPLHDVKVRGFWMDKTEVTNEQFARFVAASGYITFAERQPESAEASAPPEQRQAGAFVFTPPDPAADLSQGIQVAYWRYAPGACWRHPSGPESNIAGKEKFPVTQVCWDDAVAFARWAAKRLPTEAEWEYAARGGAMHSPYVWGRGLTPGGRWPANVWQGHFPVENKVEDGFAGLAPAGSFPPNDYGLLDMAGNVWEWCADWYRADYYVRSPYIDPPGPDSSVDPDEAGVPKRVVRGGSFLSSETNGAGYRPSARLKKTPHFACSDIGFRCARSTP